VGKMQMMGRSGHETIEWDADDAESCDRARAVFDKYKADGLLAFRDDGFERSSLMREFEPEAGVIYFSPQMAGG